MINPAQQATLVQFNLSLSLMHDVFHRHTEYGTFETVFNQLDNATFSVNEGIKPLTDEVKAHISALYDLSEQIEEYYTKEST